MLPQYANLAMVGMQGLYSQFKILATLAISDQGLPIRRNARLMESKSQDRLMGSLAL